MAGPQRYKKKPSPQNFITAVQLDLDTAGFTYNKWGGEQKCKPGDWLVKNHLDGETYTVDAESFAETYVEESPGVYRKRSPVWATPVESESAVKTKEGESQLDPGDYVVSNHQDGTDAYAVKHDDFHEMYEPDE